MPQGGCCPRQHHGTSVSPYNSKNKTCNNHPLSPSLSLSLSSPLPLDCWCMGWCVVWTRITMLLQISLKWPPPTTPQTSLPGPCVVRGERRENREKGGGGKGRERGREGSERRMKRIKGSHDTCHTHTHTHTHTPNMQGCSTSTHAMV